MLHILTAFVEQLTSEHVRQWAEYCAAAAELIDRLRLTDELADGKADDRAMRVAKAILRAVIDDGPAAARPIADSLFRDVHHRQVLNAYRELANTLFSVQYVRSDREVAHLYPDITAENRAAAERILPPAVLPDPINSHTKQADPGILPPDMEFAAVADLAARLGKKREAVQVFISRLKKRKPGYFIPVSDRREGEAQYLCRVADVWPLLQKAKDGWQDEPAAES
jgi:hypothetical protein